MTGRRLARLLSRGLYNLVLLLIVAYMLAPSLIVTVLSFSAAHVVRFPPPSWGTRQYEVLFNSGDWLDPTLRSLLVAVLAAALATAIALGANLGFTRGHLPGASAIQMIGLGPVLMPAVAYALALYGMLASFNLLGHWWALIVLHTVLVVPFALLTVGAGLRRIPVELELAALSLGASGLRAWRDVTIRLLAPALTASLILSFAVSLDETVVTSFLGYPTLPVSIFNSVRFGIDPVITAIATLLTGVAGVLMTGYVLSRRRLEGGI